MTRCSPVGIALGMLGGTMWPLEIVPQAMRTVGHLTPHAWAMDAFIALMGKGADLASIAPQIAILLALRRGPRASRHLAAPEQPRPLTPVPPTTVLAR